jgi:hypothetical protein
MKINTIRAFVETALSWSAWANVIGLRHDEAWRVLKAVGRNEENKTPWRSVMPLAKAKVTKADVMAFWAVQPFDLGLRPL